MKSSTSELTRPNTAITVTYITKREGVARTMENDD